MIGLVLCGGQSSRMGTDKGLLINPKKVTWAQQSFSLLAKMDLPVIISVNETQHRQYKRIFPMQELVLDNISLDIHGPLLGLLSVHLRYPNQDIFVLACDMVEMNSMVLNYLHNYYQHLNKKETCVFTHENSSEPLCAIYRSKDLAKILHLYQKGALEKYSLMYCLEQFKTTYLPVKSEWKNYFMNANSPKDLLAI